MPQPSQRGGRTDSISGTGIRTVIEHKYYVDDAGSGLHLYREIIFRKNTRIEAEFRF
jgi:hypothetical protein